jgi:N-methylhydantoinase A
MRYRGQGHEITVALPARAYQPADAALLRAGFETAYTALFGRVIPRLEVEALTWSLSLATARALPKPVSDPPAFAAPAPNGRRALLDPATGEQEMAALYERAALPMGSFVEGPALIAEDGTTTVVPRGFTARINALGQIVMESLA